MFLVFFICSYSFIFLAKNIRKNTPYGYPFCRTHGNVRTIGNIRGWVCVHSLIVWWNHPCLLVRLLVRLFMH